MDLRWVVHLVVAHRRVVTRTLDIALVASAAWRLQRHLLQSLVHNLHLFTRRSTVQVLLASLTSIGPLEIILLLTRNRRHRHFLFITLHLTHAKLTHLNILSIALSYFERPLLLQPKFFSKDLLSIDKLLHLIVQIIILRLNRLNKLPQSSELLSSRLIAVLRLRLRIRLLLKVLLNLKLVLFELS